MALISVIVSIFGFWVGYVTSLKTGRYFQDRQFQKQERDKKALMKSMLEVLRDDIKEYYIKLKDLRNKFMGGSYPNEYIVLSNIQAMWPEMIKSSLITKNRDIFKRISRMWQRLDDMNLEIEALQDTICGFSPVDKMDKTLVMGSKHDIVVSIIDSIIGQDILEDGGKAELATKLDAIIESL